MSGPGVGWYLIVAAIMFGTGAMGVMLRRSPLIVLLSLEIMLNGANLALIAFARQTGSLDGQVFALDSETDHMIAANTSSIRPISCTSPPQRRVA